MDDRQRSCGGRGSSVVEKVHEWRPRRSRFGELVQWDTSDHDWLEGRGEEILSDQHDRRCDQPVVRSLCEQRFHGGEHEPAGAIPGEVRAAVGVLHRQSGDLSDRGENASAMAAEWGKSREEMPPTQIGRASAGVGNPVDCGAQSSGERAGGAGFLTAQDRLVKGMRVAGVTTMERSQPLPGDRVSAVGQRDDAVVPANPDDAHRPLGEATRFGGDPQPRGEAEVNADYTFPLDAKIYRIAAPGYLHGTAGSQRARGAAAGRFGCGALQRSGISGWKRCEQQPKVASPQTRPEESAAPSRRREATWNKNFDLKKGAEGLAGSASSPEPDARNRNDRMSTRLRRWREGKVRPIPGNSPHDRLVSRGISSSLKESLRRSLPRHSLSAAAKQYWAPSMRF